MITHAVSDAQMNLTLSLITMSVPSCITSLFLSGDMLQYCHGEVVFLHDLITRVFLQSLQHGIVVMGFLDAFVYAHHQHRHGFENPGNFGHCMKGRIRCMTAITPVYAHAYQATCLAQHFPGVPHHTFRLPKPKSRYLYLSSDRSITRERGNDYRGWALYTDGGTRVVDGETLAGWGVISRSSHGRIDVMFGPVVTTEAHPACSGARTHSKNTAEMSAMIEALFFSWSSWPSGPGCAVVY